MALGDYAQALGAAQQLVPSYDQLRMNALAMRGEQLQQVQQQQQIDATNQQIADQNALKQGMIDLGANPTAQQYRQLGARFPQFAQGLSKAADGLDAAKRQQVVSETAQIRAALANGQPQLARARLQRHIDAAKAAGQEPDPDDQALIGMIDSGDPEQIKAAQGMLFSVLAATDPKVADAVKPDDGDHFSSTGDGVIYDKRTGAIIREATAKPEYRTVKNADGSESIVQVGGTEGGGPASGGGAARGDVSRLINSDAGGGYVPKSVKTVGQFVNWGRALNQRGAKSSSAGTYQINGSTMAEFAPQALGPNWRDQPYTADAQEKVGKAIFDWAKQQPAPASALKGRWVSLSQQQAAQLVRGDWAQARGVIAQGETGGGPGASATRGGGSGSRVVYTSNADPGAAGTRLDDATVNTMAQQYLAGDPSVMTNLGRGKQGAENIVRLRSAIAQQARAQGMSGAQIASVMQDYKMHQQGLNAFAKGPEARTVRSLNVTIDHLDTLQNAAQALQNRDIRIFNKVGNAWARATGRAAPTNFEAVKQIVSTEVAKAIVGGQTALADRKDIAEGISAANSPQQLAGWIAEAKKLLGGQLDGLAGQYKSATGRDDFADRLSPRTKRALGYDRPQQNAGGFRILSRRPK